MPSDHACRGDPYTCRRCSDTRQAYKHQKKKSSRHAKFDPDEEGFITKKEVTRLPIARPEGKRYTEHFYFP